MSITRCQWCTDDPQYIKYHDEEWGVPLHDDTKLFEMLVLEGAQAGLSWLTILKKRDGYRRAFENWDLAKISRFGQDDIERLAQNPEIIRNRLKIASVIKNARGSLEIIDQYGSLDEYLWRYVDYQPQTNQWKRLSDLPVSTDVSERMSKDLKKRGFNFVGPTICYAYMQAVGMVNDHVVSCFRYQEVKALTR